MKNKLMGIYKITNKINNKMYIGSSKNITDRWNYHLDDLKYEKHHSYKLQKEYLEFGVTNFTFEIIEVVDDIAELLDIEQKWMDYYRCYNIGYNVSMSSKERKLKKDIETDKEQEDKEIYEAFGLEFLNNVVANKKDDIRIKRLKELESYEKESSEEFFDRINS